MASHSSVLAWRIPGTGEPGGLPSMGSHRVGHDWSDLAAAVTSPLEKEMATHSSILTWRIPWMEELLGYSPWGRKESDTTGWLFTFTLLYYLPNPVLIARMILFLQKFMQFVQVPYHRVSLPYWVSPGKKIIWANEQFWGACIKVQWSSIYTQTHPHMQTHIHFFFNQRHSFVKQNIHVTQK